MSIETAKLELIQWIVNLKDQDQLEQVLTFKQKYEQQNSTYDNQSIKPTKLEEARGIYKGKVWMSEDFDEPLEDFKDYM